MNNANFKVFTFFILNSICVAGLIFSPISSRAEIIEEKLSYPIHVKWQKKDPGLVLIKTSQEKKKWKTCINVSKKEFRRQFTIRSWVLVNWLNCSLKLADETSDYKSLQVALDVLEKNRDLLLTGSAKTNLLALMVKARLLLAENLKSDGKLSSKLMQAEYGKNLEILISYGDRLDKDTKSKTFYYLEELATAQHNLMGAKQFLEQSLNEKESKNAREKLNSILLALGEADADTSSKPYDVVLPEKEAKAEARLEESQKNNDHMIYIDDGVSYLNNFPNGRKAKAVQERILEIYSEIVEKAVSGVEQEKFQALRDRAISSMENVDAIRAFEWAKSLHRRGDFMASLRLAQKASILMKSPKSAQLLWMMGRSAQFLGMYRKAQQYFEQYVELNSGGDEFAEVLFRLALVHIRQNQYPAAVATLEKLLVTHNNDRYELSARYWLVRALEAQKNSRSVTEANTVVERYPFSYYGIRLKAEQDGGVFELPASFRKIKLLKTSLYLSSFQKAQLERIKTLSENGWLLEAQKEISDFTLPKQPLQKILLAQNWLGAKAFPVVIRLTNEAIDVDPSLRSLDLIAVSFPQEFKAQIQTEAEKQGLNPILVQSLIRQESAFGTQALSLSNALGLMQLIPPTAQDVAQELKIGKINIPEDVYDPDVNIQMGTYYIAKMIRQFGGCVPLGLAAYNAGPHRIQAFIQSRPEVLQMTRSPSSSPSDEIWFDELPWNETSFYVKAILRNSLIYKTLEQGKVTLGSVIWSDLAQSPKGPSGSGQL